MIPKSMHVTPQITEAGVRFLQVHRKVGTSSGVSVAKIFEDGTIRFQDDVSKTECEAVASFADGLMFDFLYRHLIGGNPS